MAVKNKAFTRKKALLILLVGAVIALLLITARSVFSKDEAPDLSTAEGREAYLNALGWEIDPDTESFRTVLIPDQLEGIMAQYNKIQIKQGFDLNRHLGESCMQYCYELTNYPGGEGKVVVSLYIQDGELIAAGIHSTAVNGFMQGLLENASE